MKKSINICLTINLGVSSSKATPNCIKAIHVPVPEVLKPSTAQPLQSNMTAPLDVDQATEILDRFGHLEKSYVGLAKLSGVPCPHCGIATMAVLQDAKRQQTNNTSPSRKRSHW